MLEIFTRVLREYHMFKMVRKSYSSIEYVRLKSLLGIESWSEDDVATLLEKKNFNRPAGDSYVYPGNYDPEIRSEKKRFELNEDRIA